MSSVTLRLTTIAPGDVAVSALVRAEVECRGVDAVLARERALGRNPEEQTHNNPGIDVLSRPAGGAGIRIEVKAPSRVPIPSPSLALRCSPRSTPHPTTGSRSCASACNMALHR